MENNEIILSKIDLLTELKASIQITTGILLANVGNKYHLETEIAVNSGIVTTRDLVQNIIDAEIEQLKQQNLKND